MTEYHCPNCGYKISFGESICPNCKSDVTNVWEVTPKKDTPKVPPGMGGMDISSESPFPPATNNSPFPPKEKSESPFPAPANNSPFPPPAASDVQPFPPASESSPFPSTPQESPFSSPTGDSKPFPPIEAQAIAQTGGPYLEIPKIGGKIPIPEGELRIGRDEIQGVATKALPDLNAYKNISRKRENSEHFIIRNENGSIKIEDRGSTNGTYIGSEKITGNGPRELRNGDTFILPIEEFGKMVQLDIILRKD
ncbi:MAG: FHA domain-containing protein [Promethearchaeota archaeon]